LDVTTIWPDDDDDDDVDDADGVRGFISKTFSGFMSKCKIFFE
jgi:hypothetical protein